MGLSGAAISYRLAAGRLHSPHPGVYALPGLGRTWDQQLLAALLAAGADSAISHFAAGGVWGLEGVKAECPHVIVPHTRRLRLQDVVVHRTRNLTRGEIVSRGPLRLTSLARTLMDLAGVLDLEVLEDAIDDALRKRLVTVSGLVGKLDKQSVFRGAGNLRRLLSERSSTRESGSGLENRFRRKLVAARLPRPVPQYEIRDKAGRLVARVDFAYPQARLAIEIDGYGSHSGRKRWESDLARQNRLMVEGWRLLRFSIRDIDGDVSGLFTTIKAVLAHAGESKAKRTSGGFPKEARQDS